MTDTPFANGLQQAAELRIISVCPFFRFSFVEDITPCFIMETTPRSYLLLFRDSTPSVYRALSPEERQHLLERWNAWYERLEREGKVQHGHPLEPVGRVVSAVNGRVVDGPYIESKEAIGGYFYVVVADQDEAVAIARQCPSLQIGLTVEVRPVADTCPVLKPADVAKQVVALGRN